MKSKLWNSRTQWRARFSLFTLALVLPCMLTAQQSTGARAITSALSASALSAPGGADRTIPARDKNNDGLKNRQPLATVDGQPIYEDDLPATVQGQILSIRNQEYEAKRNALDGLIEQKLLEVTASKQGISSDELLKREVDSKISEPSNAEVEAFYLGIKDRVNKPFNEIQPQVRESLKQVRAYQAKQDYLKRLREDTNIAVLLNPPRVEVTHDPSRVRGTSKPKVMIVEFSDYQCPYCHSAESTIRNILAKYGDKVSLSYRDFPLTQIHANAQSAAEASRCAGEQGKFWEYHDQLFTASKLEKDALIGYARDLKLDESKFTSCLNSEKYKAEIEKDIREGRKAGVSGTPSFFINGASTSGAQQETLMRMIDEELSRKR